MSITPAVEAYELPKDLSTLNNYNNIAELTGDHQCRCDFAKRPKTGYGSMSSLAGPVVAGSPARSSTPNRHLAQSLPYPATLLTAS